MCCSYKPYVTVHLFTALCVKVSVAFKCTSLYKVSSDLKEKCL